MDGAAESVDWADDLSWRPQNLTVAVLTFRRPEVLAVTLPTVLAHVRAAAELFEFQVGVLVVDNDAAASAELVVARLADPLVRYEVEPTPGISAARNHALRSAGTDLLVFLDDDEEPRSGWLENLLRTRRQTGAGLVCGKVDAVFAGPLDPWIAAGEFFRRFTMPTGTVIHTAAAGNLLIDLRQVLPTGIWFENRFGLSGGEDNLFSRRLDGLGVRMVWCEESVATDHVPTDRMTRRWVLVRSFSHGNSHGLVDIELAADAFAAQLTVRGLLVGAGAVRLIAGALRWAGGLLVGVDRHQARGARTAYRGAGMLAAVAGLAYQEYGRGGVRLVRASPRHTRRYHLFRSAQRAQSAGRDRGAHPT